MAKGTNARKSPVIGGSSNICYPCGLNVHSKTDKQSAMKYKLHCRKCDFCKVLNQPFDTFLTENFQVSADRPIERNRRVQLVEQRLNDILPGNPIVMM